MATTPRKDLPGTNAPNWSQRVTEELRVLMGRGGNGRALTAKDLIDSGIAKPGAGGGLVPGGAGEYQPDLTPPPTPTGFVANSAISNIVIEHDAPAYTQGHGHGMTVVYGVIHQPDSQLPTFDQAVELMRFGGIVASYSTNPATKWRLWIKWLSVDGVLSVAPAGGINGLGVETGQDVAKLLDALQGKITESQLYAHLGSRIDLLDKEDGPLGRSLVTAAQQQDALNQSVRGNINQMAEGLLEAALAADKALERITDAGVYVDPATGQVKIYGLEQTKGQVTELSVQLDAVKGQMLLKASTAYVDGKIAEAVLSPADLLLYEGIDARLVSVTQELDSINGQLSQKADALELQGALVRLTTAESNLDALGGLIALRVTRAEYQADQDALQQRLGSAELTINALDVPAITATVMASSRSERDAEKSAEALLRDILSGERNREHAADALAFARNQLSAAITDGLAAEAQQRLQLAATVGEQGAALTQESKARADADAAEALARQQLAAETQQGQQTLSAAIEQEASTRSNAVSAEAQARQQLQAVVEGNHTDAMQAAQAASDAAGGKGKVLYGSSQPAVEDRVEQNLWIDTTSGFNTPKRWNGSTWASVTDKAATDAAAAAATAQSTANNAVAAIQAEQSVRANETGYLGALYSVRMQLSQGDQKVVGGFALSGTSNGTAGPTIDFGVMANSFWIAAPAGSPAGVSNVKPFTVQTTAQTINGVVVPAGVYMDAAYINNVTVLFGRFGTLLADKIQATAISASQLTAGNGVIGGTLKSSNYVAGSSGWILRPDGMAEFSGVIVRGTVYATAGQIGGWNITLDRIRSAGFTTNDGVELRSDGRIYARNAATNVLFNLAATGTGEVLRVGNALVINAQGDAIFGGTLSARVVRTDNIIGDAIVRSWAGTTPGPIAVGDAATGGSWQGAHVAVNATPGRPLIINPSITYDMADNWYASQYGQRDQRFYLSVYCDRFDASGAWNSRVELFGVESGRAIRLDTAVIAYGIGLATSTFRAIAPSVVFGGYNVYYAEVRCAGIGFIVRHGSLVVQEQRV
ncbi:DUF1983 domain-containing protein [Comamonas thiooxydans]|uniref:DUF1983 domain-containing protein n=1 Tax=Comamonas thiooxydans TaxID=363952 RepID=UPI0001BB11F5|nr:DUF1983 domain-containing protein [Comamonas thiooxydans]ACY33386.1 hypothetical protein CtCNB1_2640 [Comamonas thiooxydans]MDO1476057.1 DUF1983 domain-containing protein [Comamonas thiooxydans]